MIEITELEEKVDEIGDPVDVVEVIVSNNKIKGRYRDDGLVSTPASIEVALV